MELIDLLQIRQCPLPSFQAGSLRNSFYVVGLLGVVLPVSFGARHAVLLLPSVRKVISEILRASRWHIVLGAVIAIAGGVAIWIASFSQYCLSEHAILHRNQPWQSFQTHQWRDIARIDVGCRRGGRGRADAFYVLVMRDGTMLNISDSLKKLENGYPQLQRQLRGQPFRFDASAVAVDCPAPRADLLRIRP
jgi:hypothetical protein